MKTIRRSVTAAFLAATTLFAQQQPQTELPKLSETIDVRVINVDVVVTDKKGNPITGLKKEDFHLYENGVPKTVTNFYEVEGSKALNVVAASQPGVQAPPPAAQPAREEIPENLRRRIIFFVDNLSLMPFNRNRVFKEMKEFARNVMRPGDEAMVATWNRSMKVRVNFTRDPIQIQQMLDIIAGESALGVSNKSETRDTQKRIKDTDTYDDAVATARTYAQSVEHDLRQTLPVHEL